MIAPDNFSTTGILRRNLEMVLLVATIYLFESEVIHFPGHPNVSID